jgi:hypothetical protein
VVTAFDPAHDACYVLDIAARRASARTALRTRQFHNCRRVSAAAAARRLSLLRCR